MTHLLGQPCFGIMCPLHTECLRYQEIEGYSGNLSILPTCEVEVNGVITRPLFLRSSVTLETS